jgi:small subunit ribosomal protein S6
MRKYETLCILNPDLDEGQTQSAIEKIKGIIAQGEGTILKFEDWGVRKLAYLIQKKDKGHYFLIHFSGTPALLSELERNFRVMDAVTKFQSVRLDERKESAVKGSPPEEPTPEPEPPPEEEKK